MNPPKLFYIFICTFFPLFFLCAITEAVGGACPEYRYFAVDAEENVYIGQKHEIVVYNTQSGQSNRFDAPTNRGYKFTYIDPYGLVICTSYNYYVVDISGNITLKLPVTDDNRSLSYGIPSRSFVSADGTRYIMKDRFLRTSIFRLDGSEKTELFRMPLNDYVIRLLKALNCANAAVSVPVIAYLWIKSKKEEAHERAYSHR